MSNADAGPGKLPAILESGNAQVISGRLSALLDGRLELYSPDIEARPALLHELTPAADNYATLSVPPPLADNASLEAVRVRITRGGDATLLIEFAAADSELARLYRDALAADLTDCYPGKSSSSRAADGFTTTAQPTADERHRRPGADAKDTQPEEAEKAEKPEHANRTPALPVSAAYASLLEKVKTEGPIRVVAGLQPFLRDLVDQLMELSTRLRLRKHGENCHYTAALAIRHHHRDIIDGFVDRLQSGFDNLTPGDSKDQLWRHSTANIDELTLVDEQEFEDRLLIDRLENHGEELHQASMEALTLRLSELVAVDPNTLRNPLHVRQLCEALRASLLEVQVPAEVIPDVLTLFGKEVIPGLDVCYQALNTILGDAGVRPAVESEISARGSLLEPRESAERPPGAHREQARKDIADSPSASASREDAAGHSGSREPGGSRKYSGSTEDRGITEPYGGAGHSGDVAGAQGGGTAADELDRGGAHGRFTPESLYRSVVDALNFKRAAEGLLENDTLDSGATLSGTWEGATVASSSLDQTQLADAQAIAAVLQSLQRDSRARGEVQTAESLRAWLAENRADIAGLRESSGLTTQSLNQLDLVDNLFGTIASQLDVSGELQATLANLKIPLARLALTDPRFFVDQGHSARAVVDRLAALAASGNYPNKALEERINRIVDNIIADYDTDDAVFDKALEATDRLVAQQQQALSRNVERIVRTQEGQEKLTQARRSVDALIATAVPAPQAPRALVDLIENGWRDTLVLSHLKEGAESSAWREQAGNFELLCRWLGQQQADEQDEDRSVERSLEAEPLLELIGAQIAAALPANMAHEAPLEELRNILAGIATMESVPTETLLSAREADPAALHARLEELPRLRRWVARVEELELKSWLTYRDASGQKKRMQLAWVSAARDRYIFVNDRGQKVADLSNVQLARQLSRGMQPPAPADKLSVMDQSMYQTLENVQTTLSFARNHDSLTRLINRETFLDQMGRTLRHSRHKQSQHAVLYMNIDQFSLVNEIYDRISGDQVLLEFARLLAQLHGRKSSSARIEADEFAVLLLDQPLESALQAAEKVRADIAASSMDINGENVSFTVSIGVASIAEHSPPVEQILAGARSAMQHAKQAGRNQVVEYRPEQDDASEYKRARQRTQQSLEEALSSDRFVLRAQPIVQTAVQNDGRSSLHYELLLGLKNRDGSLVSPGEFIHSAERYGFMTLVDRWVVREAFSWISGLMDEQKVIPNLAINLSGASVTDDAFLEYLLEQISDFGVGTSRLCFEITETGTISNLVKAADFVRAFRNIGCKFSIDDFGTGIASHNYLRELPVDYVKIDGSFITGIHKNRSDYAMARSINDLAHFLNQETIAESVENRDIITRLEEIGVDYLQGWGVGRPKLLSEVSEDLSSIEK